MLPFITQPAVAPAYPIENSLLFRGGQSLSRTPGVAGDQRTFTFSCWCRLPSPQHYMPLLSGPICGLMVGYGDGGNAQLTFESAILALDCKVRSVSVLHDPTAWYHVVLAVDTNLAPQSSCVRMYVNGSELAHDPATSTYPRFQYATGINGASIHEIGRWTTAAVVGSQNQLAEIVLIDGQALPPSAFGKADPVTGSWQPKKLAGIDFGPNGFHLGKPWDFDNLGKDYSGRGNHWVPGGFATSDVVVDSPTNVYATLNPLVLTGGSLSDGNLKLTGVSGSFAFTSATVPMDTGKWFFEFTVERPQDTNDRSAFGIAASGGLWADVSSSSVAVSNLSGTIGFENNTGAGSATNLSMYSGSHSAGDVYSFLVDIDGNAVSIKRNGTLFMAATGIQLSGKKWWPYVSNGATAGRTALIGSFNFGQHPFAHPPSTDAMPLCTANLPATTGETTGSFTGNGNADGPCVFTGAVPQTLTINGNSVTWGVHADKLATGFKLRTASADYNASGANNWVATYSRKPTVGRNHVPANAQANP